MARPFNIPNKYFDEIVTLSSEGYNAERIVEHLANNYSLNVTMNNVYRVLRSRKKERQEAAQKIYAEAAALHAYKDLDIIDSVIDRLNKEYKLSLDAGNKKEATELLNTMHKFQSKRMELSGLGHEAQDNEELVDEAKESLLKRLPN